MIPFPSEAAALAWLEANANGECSVYHLCPDGNTFVLCGCPCVNVIERYRVA